MTYIHKHIHINLKVKQILKYRGREVQGIHQELEADMIKLYCHTCMKFLINKNVIFKRCCYTHGSGKLGNTDRITGETGNAGDVVFCPLPRALRSQNHGPVPWSPSVPGSFVNE